MQVNVIFLEGIEKVVGNITGYFNQGGKLGPIRIPKVVK
jgi:hypothetical protein